MPCGVRSTVVRILGKIVEYVSVINIFNSTTFSVFIFHLIFGISEHQLHVKN
jgi:hypothetical protein